MNLIEDISSHIKQANVVEKFIYMNIVVFIIINLFSKYLYGMLALPSDVHAFMYKPWTLITYSFVHLRFFHIFSNVLILYYIGNLFLDFFNKEKFIIYYFSGLLVGGLVFMTYFFQKETYSMLIGASAAVTAILVGLATKIPHYSLQFRFIGSIELWVIAAIWIGLSVLGTGGINAGGAMAHLGGGIIGFVLTKYFDEASSLSGWLKQNRTKKKSAFKNVYTNPKAPNTTQSYRNKKQNQRKIDAILDKISKSGYEALTKEEKDFLFNQKNS